MVITNGLSNFLTFDTNYFTVPLVVALKLCSVIVKAEDITREGSQANAQRLTNLILLIARREADLFEIAYTASCLVVVKIRNTGYQEYINRLKLEVRNALRRKHLN